MFQGSNDLIGDLLIEIRFGLVCHGCYSYFADINSLAEDVIAITADLGEIPDISDMIQGYDEIFSTVSKIINGGMVLLNINESFSIDNSEQIFSNIGIARGNTIKVIISPKTQSTRINGDYKLIFLGDHIYTSQAKDSENGLTLPLPLIIIWIIAIFLFLLFRFYLKTEANKDIDDKIIKIFLIMHVVSLIVAFILMDREISYQFGISVLDFLFSQGVSPFILAFLAVQLIMWVIGFFALAIPIRMITTSVLKYFRIGKGGKGIAKGVGVLFIWVFCAFYVKLIINIVFLFFNPSNFFPM